MGDDRHGQAPRPGDRAPWERYPTADYTERDGSTTSRRARHTDTAAESGSAPLTVQDLVQKVDNERGGRRRRAEGGARAARRAETAPAHPAERAHRTPESAPRSTGSVARPVESAGRAADPAPHPSARTPRPASSAQRPDKPAKAVPQAPARTPGNPPATPAGDTARPATSRQRAAARPSAVVDDIAGTPATGLPAPKRKARRPERPEEVTDVMAPLAEAENPEPAKSKRPGKAAWPTTGKSKTAPKTAAPKTVGSPSLSRLAASKKRRTRRLQTSGRVGAALVAVLILLITGGGWSYVRSAGDSLTKVATGLGDNPHDVVNADLQLGDENYLIVGTDTRAGLNGGMGAGTLDDAEGARADTVMLVHIPKNRKRVVAVSFPRDLDVTRPQCNGWDNDKGDYTKETFPSAIGDKLNAVYALAGPKCLVNVIRKMTGLSIGHFIGIDFAGFQSMVDTIGGVEVCAPKPIIDGVLGTVLEKGGKQRVNGETALNYVRARHVYGEERSDYDRISRQQRFMASLLRGAMSSKVLFDFPTLNKFVNAFKDHTFVDGVTPNDLLTLGRSLQKMEAGAVTFLTIPTAGTTSYGNEIPRETDIKAIFSAIREDRPLPGEKTAEPASAPSTPATPPTYTAVDPDTISLLVSNGSDVQGRALQVSNKLGNQGFNIYNVATFTGGSQTTKVRFAPGHEAEAATVASAVPGASLEADAELEGIIEVVLGRDFTGTIRTPVPVGDSITNVPTTSATNATTVALPSDLEHVNAADETCK
ncbi:LCP family protein [Nocardia sp. XZ_19_385]|uniref:LCP family protein n=1 Tax=Nocardia sp. XZ_19_385 TaxID=2769488 RepID=UPI0028156B8F|nr:LCP family protein [Nocardia sp. XZ_19_385]